LLTVKELASLLRTTPNAVRVMRTRGQLPQPVALGTKRLLWRADVIAAWLEQDRPT
jgi:predicted DNA-binding transcriptional regulator AlpA